MVTEAVNPKAEFSGQSLLRNTALSFGGQFLPILIALVSIPQLIHRLGDERFGVLMLAWMFLGYFNLFDFGLSRALTKRIAEKLEDHDQSEIPVLFWTVTISTAAFGIIGAVIMAATSKWLVTNVLKVSEALEPETLNSFLVIAFALPFVITTSCFKGVLEATQNFRAINRIQIPLGVLFYLSPLVFAHFSIYLPFVISALVISRMLGWLFYLRHGLRSLPGVSSLKTNYSLLPTLMRFGGWVTVANIPMPMIGYADRFVIGMLMSMAAVTYYSTPYEIINKVSVIPAAVLSVIFPAFAAQLVSDKSKAALTFVRANKLILIAIFPISVIAMLFAHEALLIWAGADLADHSYKTLQILSLAIFFNCFGIIPSALLDALGKPAITAISHLIQLPVYVGALFLVIPRFGLEGAAVIWVARNAIDSAILYLFAARSFPSARIKLINVLLTIAPVSILTFIVVQYGLPLYLRIWILAAIVVVFAPTVWLKVLSVSDRRWVTKRLFSTFQVRHVSTLQDLPRRRVGIALAAYNPDPNVFGNQLESIRNQTYQDWFCVVSLDSSVEDLRQRLASYFDDPKFIWIRNPSEPGVKTNFENAVRKVIELGADTVAFADQDDVWYRNKLERLAHELRKCRPLSLVHSDMHLFTADNELSAPQALATGWRAEARVLEAYSPLHFMLRNTVTGASSLFDVELAKRGLPIPKSIEFHDHWFAILASVLGEVHAIHEPLYAYRQHGANVVGLVQFRGIFYKPDEVTWFEGWKKAARGWSRRRDLYNRVLEVEGSEAVMPAIYKHVFKRDLTGTLLMLGAFVLYFKDDPSLARAFLNNGMGSLRLAARGFDPEDESDQ